MMLDVLSALPQDQAVPCNTKLGAALRHAGIAPKKIMRDPAEDRKRAGHRGFSIFHGR